MPSAGIPLTHHLRSISSSAPPARADTHRRRSTMNWRNILSLSAIMALGLALVPGNAVSQQKSLKDQLVGTWTVTSQEQVRKDGSKLERFTANPKGIAIFEASGRFVTILA